MAEAKESHIMDVQDEDGLLVERFQEGDSGAFDGLVKKYQDKVYRLCYHFIYDAGDGLDLSQEALDLSQEVFIRAFQSLGDFKGRSSFYTWLYRIAKNLCIDYLRKKKVHLSAEHTYLEDVLNSASHFSPSELAETKELESKIAKAIDMLPPKARSAFILRYYDGLDCRSISEILGCQIGTVKANLFHGARMLRKMLSPYVLGGESLN